MHEMTVAQSIIETVLAQTENKAGKVTRIAISCGQINAINDEAMRFAFDIAAAETICKGAQLKIKHIPLKADCRDCKNEFEFDLYNPACPQCGKSDFALGEDAPLLLEEIEFETRTNTD